MDRKENIRNAYRLTGSNNFYDGMITCSTVSGKAVCRLVWDMGKEECDEYLNKAFTGVPEDFAGKLLEVPVGTGILTMPLYQTLPRADITCLDYSPDMMGQAREKAERMGLQNVQFRQGDVGALPYEDSSFDIVLSLNGFHAFPDKEAAYRETFRVLKPGGHLVCLEFSTPPNAVWRALYNFYLKHLIPFWGGLITGDRDGFVYLSKSIKAFPNQQGLARMMEDAGFTDVTWKNYTGGIAAVHVAKKPE